MVSYIPLRKAVELTGLHPNTLRKYADKGTIPHYRQPSGGRMFDVSKFIRTAASTICYARVSRPKQKEDLHGQVDALSKHYPQAEIIQDIGSGLNFKRKGLRSILERLLYGEKLRIVVTHRDRLARFGFDLIEYLVSKNNGEILVLNQVSTSPESELVSDITTIVTVFSSRLHGLRGHKNKKDLIEAVVGTKDQTKTVDGSLSMGIQPNSNSEGAGISDRRKEPKLSWRKKRLDTKVQA